MTTEKPEIITTAEVWTVITNTDLTEGRGSGYVKHVAELEATARRLAKGAGVQGTDAEVRRGKAYKIGSGWFIPGMGAIVRPTKDGERNQKHLDAEHEKEERRQQAINRARELGMSEEDIEALQ